MCLISYVNNKDADQVVVHCLDSMIPVLAKNQGIKTLTSCCV